MEKGNKEGGVVEWGHAPVFLIPAVTYSSKVLSNQGFLYYHAI
jgi:hypothetical protein